MRRWFVSAAARPLGPGCKVDSLPDPPAPRACSSRASWQARRAVVFRPAIDIHNKDSFDILRRSWILEYEPRRSAALATSRPSRARRRSTPTASPTGACPCACPVGAGSSARRTRPSSSDDGRAPLLAGAGRADQPRPARGLACDQFGGSRRSVPTPASPGGWMLPMTRRSRCARRSPSATSGMRSSCAGLKGRIVPSTIGEIPSAPCASTRADLRRRDAHRQDRRTAGYEKERPHRGPGYGCARERDLGHRADSAGNLAPTSRPSSLAPTAPTYLHTRVMSITEGAIGARCVRLEYAGLASGRQRLSRLAPATGRRLVRSGRRG